MLINWLRGWSRYLTTLFHVSPADVINGLIPYAEKEESRLFLSAKVTIDEHRKPVIKASLPACTTVAPDI